MRCRSLDLSGCLCTGAYLGPWCIACARRYLNPLWGMALAQAVCGDVQTLPGVLLSFAIMAMVRDTIVTSMIWPGMGRSDWGRVDYRINQSGKGMNDQSESIDYADAGVEHINGRGTGPTASLSTAGITSTSLKCSNEVPLSLRITSDYGRCRRAASSWARRTAVTTSS